MIDYDYTFDVFKLTSKFYEDYPKDDYPELMDKDSRPYNCLLIETADYIMAIPYRTKLNPSNKDCYRFKKSARSINNNSGLDYQKMVIVSDSDYLEATGYSIDNDEYLETVENIKRIVDEAVTYVRNYVTHHTVKPMNKHDYQRAYRFTTLQYFHKELGLEK
ncbi:MAG: hypothetical protein IJH92_04950 [Mogibacterium sp.]|nr:hypothetical protein [Mogibacterium sp.]